MLRIVEITGYGELPLTVPTAPAPALVYEKPAWMEMPAEKYVVQQFPWLQQPMWETVAKAIPEIAKVLVPKPKPAPVTVPTVAPPTLLPTYYVPTKEPEKKGIAQYMPYIMIGGGALVLIMLLTR